MPPTLEEIRGAPKVLLLDHLEGGLRPGTIVELADETGYADLPTRDLDELGAYMIRGADLEHLERGLGLDEVVETVREGRGDPMATGACSTSTWSVHRGGGPAERRADQLCPGDASPSASSRTFKNRFRSRGLVR